MYKVHAQGTRYNMYKVKRAKGPAEHAQPEGHAVSSPARSALWNQQGWPMVFSGLVEEQGTVEQVVFNESLVQWDGSRAAGFVLRIAAKVVLEDATMGCSIATNGVCLTVTAFTKDWFEVNCANETLERTNLGALRVGDKVNLVGTVHRRRHASHTIR